MFAIRIPDIVFIAAKWLLRRIKWLVRHNILFFLWFTYRGKKHMIILAVFPFVPMPLIKVVKNVCICPGSALLWTELKRQGVPRRERLVRLAELGGVYVPSLYTVSRDPDTGFLRRRQARRGRPEPFPRPTRLRPGPIGILPSPTTVRWAARRPSSIACRSRLRAAAPKGAASARRQ